MRIKRRTISLFKTWMLRLAVVTIFFGGYYLYVKTSFFTITQYDVQGVDTETVQIIQNQLGELARGHHLLILPNNKIFTYHTSAITNLVREHVTDLETIDIRPVGLHTVHITVTLLTPFVRTDDGQAVTKNGIVFFTNKDISSYPVLTIASSTKKMTKIEGLPFLQLVRKDKVIEETFLEHIIAMSTRVSSIIFPVTFILVEETGDVILSNASGTSRVMFLEDTDPKKLWSTLVSSIDTEPLKGKLEHNRNGLIYLDARYGNKVFYRFNDMIFQNGKSTGILEPHATTSTTTLQRR